MIVGRRTQIVMSNSQARQSAGIPTGGQYSATTHQEPTIILTTGNSESGTSDPTGARADDMWAHRDTQFHAAQRALLDGTARDELKRDFAISGLNHDELGAAVGHSPRIAKRVVTGKEPLNVNTVATYFRALGHQPSAADVQDYEEDQSVLAELCKAA